MKIKSPIARQQALSIASLIRQRLESPVSLSTTQAALVEEMLGRIYVDDVYGHEYPVEKYVYVLVRRA